VQHLSLASLEAASLNRQASPTLVIILEGFPASRHLIVLMTCGDGFLQSAVVTQQFSDHDPIQTRLPALYLPDVSKGRITLLFLEGPVADGLQSITHYHPILTVKARRQVAAPPLPRDVAMTDLFFAAAFFAVGSTIVFIDTYCTRWFPDTGGLFPNLSWRHRSFAVAKIAYRGANLAGLPAILISSGVPELLSGRSIWCALGAIELVWLGFVVGFPLLDYLFEQIVPYHRENGFAFGLLFTTALVVQSLPAVLFAIVLSRYVISLSLVVTLQISLVDWMGLLFGCVWSVSFLITVYELRNGLRV
jgi:hypothetical protein